MSPEPQVHARRRFTLRQLESAPKLRSSPVSPHVVVSMKNGTIPKYPDPAYRGSQQGSPKFLETITFTSAPQEPEREEEAAG